MEDDYGKCPENPILLKTISDSILFMDSLVSESGFCIIYHRKGCSKFGGTRLIDSYEIMTTNNEYDTFYIYAYNPTNILIPPKGFVFDTISTLYFNSRRDTKNYSIDEKYLLTDSLDWEEEETNEKELNSAPTLISSIYCSIGTNLKVKDFPFELIKKYLKDEGDLKENEIQSIIENIKPREIL